MDRLYEDMETNFWESEFDPEALNISTDDAEMDWPIFDRESIKTNHVIYQDKLISDALFGCQPIKTEHSYSLNSDGDSIPDSPRSLQNKIDEMDDDYEITINSNILSTKTSAIKHINNNDINLVNHNTVNSTLKGIKNALILPSSSNQQGNDANFILSTSSSNMINFNTDTNSSEELQARLAFTSPKLINNRGGIGNAIAIDCFETDTVDDSMIKEEPLSPDSSCPPSPNASTSSSASILVTQSTPQNVVTSQFGTINVNLANVATYTNADLVFEHNKNGSLQLSPASHSLLKNQQIILNGTQQRIVVPKINIRMDGQQTQGFGLPPTPPSSLSSDDSEDNQSAEIHTIPSSPASSLSSYSPNSSQAQASQQQTVTSKNISQSGNGGSPNSSRAYSTSSSRQPIHTPLISNQPKGSTGQLELTEEEKRTLIAEGYPIPTRLPLTKSEEKSLKKIRRKIKNKISAQESRRKKKEYMDKLERQVELLVSEKDNYLKRIETLEETNSNLMNQLSKLQAMINRQTSNAKRT
ncbi:cyclic AMP response element-binding protein A isoform X2 [Contarinia nasturtii]|uniref:cyclic AMP response element-binding protein A isoform X2 n=1 Tax=Contarinia nasturtii TaxID=265458 RepID=UPI0012D4717D|nr:cyclic AMP response element-binding protein A isoform X2 [Contarinia nasturtii]